MKQLVKRKLYTISVDTSKHRLYYVITGFWDNNAVDVDDYMQNWKEVISHVSKGFTLLTDATEFRVMTKEWADRAIQVQKMMVEAGLSKTAAVFSQEGLPKMQSDRISKHSGMTKKVFTDMQEAEAWLDQPDK